MMEDKYSRRRFLGKYFIAGSIGFAAIIGLSAKELIARAKGREEDQEGKQDKSQQAAAKNPCDNMEGVSAEEQAKRKKLAYVNKTPIPDSHCSNCALYIPAGKDKPCGGCLLFKGPVRTEGYCAYWAPINN